VSGTLENKHALVTGAARGIGRAVALSLADASCHVLAADVAQDDLSELSAGLSGGRALVCDVRSLESIRTALGSVQQLDILVNCAGVILRDRKEFTPDGFEHVVNVNLHGTMRMCYACHDLLAASRGCVLNIASMLSVFGSGHVPAYSASKGGIVQLTRSLAIAWAPEGIRVNAIAPGWIKTQMTEPLYEDAARDAEILARTPLARWGRPEDVCGAAVFLCSAAAEFITGVVLPVDGGYSIG
jgi:NAD(P)-dependent dehydrogenase (short-subunit alcohol dehydrogenase family)